MVVLLEYRSGDYSIRAFRSFTLEKSGSAKTEPAGPWALVIRKSLRIKGKRGSTVLPPLFGHQLFLLFIIQTVVITVFC